MIAATEAEHNKLAADRASSAPVQDVHRYYSFVVEDRGRLGKSALTVVYIFAVLLAVHNFYGDALAFGQEGAPGAITHDSAHQAPAAERSDSNSTRTRIFPRISHQSAVDCVKRTSLSRIST
eukprot:jgi/Tetstr1/429425/TSEL_019335.t1